MFLILKIYIAKYGYVKIFLNECLFKIDSTNRKICLIERLLNSENIFSKIWLSNSSLLPRCREEFIHIIQSAQRGPRILEEAWEDDVTMEGLTTRCNLIIARSAVGGDTVGVKLRP